MSAAIRPAATPRIRRSGVQLDDVAVGEGMVAADLLPVECVAAPEPGVAEVGGDLLVDEGGDIAHRLAALYGEGPGHVGWLAGDLRVHAHDAEVLEQERAELIEAGAVDRRH